MDIIGEPQMFINSVVEQDMQWQHYKKEFEENEYTIKTERYCTEDGANITEKLTCQEAIMNLGKTKSEMDSTSDYKNKEKTFRIKVEVPDDERSISESTLETQPICSLTAIPNPASHFKKHTSVTVVKEELAPPKEVKGADFLKCGDNCDLQPRYPVPSLVAQMKLRRVPFYRRNFICDVCFDIFPTMSENKLHKRIHNQSTSHSLDERLNSQEPLVGLVNVSKFDSSFVENIPEVLIKIEKPDAEEPYSDSRPLTSQNKTAIRPGCSPVTSSCLTPHSDIRIDEMDIKKELTYSEGVDNSLLNDCSYDCEFRSYSILSGLVARIRLNRVPFYIRNFVCNVCYEVFPTDAEQRFHKLIHKQLTERIVEREFCGPYHLKHSEFRQRKKYRSVENRFKCDSCDFACRHLWKLRRHRLSHLQEKPFKCDECDYACIYYSAMKRHKMVHSGEKPFQCPDCDYSCILYGRMKEHRMIHTGEKPLKCEECDYSSIYSNKMKLHKMIHSGEKPFKCDECDYSCIQFSSMKKHKMNHSGEKPLKCEICNYSCVYSSQMKSHSMIHSESTNSREKRFKCDVCDYSCVISGNMKKHRMIHSGEKPLKCPDCEYSCIQSSNMKQHKMTHSAEKPFTCEECDFSCINATVMKKHKMVHSGDIPFKCEECGFFCVHSSQMKIHKMIHAAEKPFKCNECEYSCTQNSAMKIHKLIHSGEKPFKCHTCKYECRRSSDLKNHQKIHSGDLPYKCEECSYSTIYFSLIKKHKMIHSGEKPFKCQDCDYSTIFSGHLKAHKMIHSGEKPFKCDICLYACRRTNDLKKHKMIHTV